MVTLNRFQSTFFINGILVLLSLLATVRAYPQTASSAQTDIQTDRTLINPSEVIASATEDAATNEIPSPVTKLYKGYYHFKDDETGDTMLMIVFNPRIVLPKERFKSKKQEQFYWKTVRDVRKCLPYAKLICSMLLETYEYLETFPTQKEKEKFMKDYESAIFAQYKPVMKTFTRSQGQMMMKLINRETNQSSYHIVKAFLGGFRASFWYAFGKLFGVSMRSAYRPDSDEKDAIIERICIRIEMGEL